MKMPHLQELLSKKSEIFFRLKTGTPEISL